MNEEMQHFLLGLRATVTDMLQEQAAASPLRTVAAALGAGFLLGLVMPKSLQPAMLLPLWRHGVQAQLHKRRAAIDDAVARWIATVRARAQS